MYGVYYYLIEWFKIINNFFASILIFLTINFSFLCDKNHLDLVIRNNINGDYTQINEIKDIQPGAFVNIDWNSKNLMLPYSPKKGIISFSDKKWEWRYKYENDGSLNESEPILYELLSSGKYIKHICKKEE